jgi:signal transduction histidine kinase
MHLIAETLMFGLGLFLMVVLISTLLRERKTQEELASAHRQLQQFAQQVEDLAAVQERNRIAREIHDALGHSLTALNVQLQTAVKLWKHDPDQAQPFLDQAQRLGVNVMQEVRHSVNALREDARNNTPLEVAITSLVEDFRQGIGIPVTTEIDLRSPLPASTVKALYRIVQEALTNICKHSQATAVEIQVSTTTNHLCLSIRDNGRGFPPERQTAGFGLQSMRQRTIALSGRFYIDSAPGLGCQITVELPLEEVANDSVAPSRRPKPDLSGPEGHVRVGARFTSGGICP